MQRRILQFTLTSVLCALLLACGTGSSSGDKGSTLDDSSAQTKVITTQSGGLSNDSSISIRLTDAPIDNLVRAVVQFTAVQLKLQAGGWVKFTLDTPKSIDLLKLQGGNTADLLINVPVPAADYKEIRLFTGNGAMVNFVEEFGGGIEPLQIPGGSGSGLMLKQDFVIPMAQAASFIIDFDLRQSIRSPDNSGNYQFKEVMQLVTLAGVGGFRGEVDPMRLTNPPSDCSDNMINTFNAAYVFSGHDVTPSDININGNNIKPVTTTSVNLDGASGKYIYEVAFLPAGNYTVAVTCNADLDDLEADDDLKFFDFQNVIVVENNTVFL